MQPPTPRPGLTIAADRAVEGWFAADDYLCGGNRRNQQAGNEVESTLRRVWLSG
jgi:hypothetical protein